MFGISWAEFLVILLVGILVIPVKHWPDVAKFLAKGVKFIRDLIWKISDASEKIKEQIDLEKPINDLIKNTTDDVISSFSTVIKKRPQKSQKVIKTPVKAGKLNKKSGGRK